MTERDQFQIIQDVLQYALGYTEKNYKQLVINFYIREGWSTCKASYLIEKNGVDVEVYISEVANLDPIDAWLRELRNHLGQLHPQLFTRCRIHVTEDHRYEARYSYDPVDLASTMPPPPNFPLRPM